MKIKLPQNFILWAWLLGLLLFPSLPLLAQQTTSYAWGGTEFDNYLSTTSSTKDGGFVAVSQTGNFANTPALGLLVNRYDKNRKIIWSKYIQEDFVGIYGHDVVETQDGGIVIVGEQVSIGTHHNFMTKLDSTGKMLWSNVIMHDFKESNVSGLNCVQETSNGQLVVAGWQVIDWRVVSVVMTLDQSGRPDWSRSYRFQEETKFEALALDASDNIFVAGHSTTNFPASRIVVAKINSDGSFGWSKAFSAKKDSLTLIPNHMGFNNLRLFVSGTVGYHRPSGSLTASQTTDGFLLTMNPQGHLYESNMVVGDSTSVVKDVLPKGLSLYVLHSAKGINLTQLEVDMATDPIRWTHRFGAPLDEALHLEHKQNDLLIGGLDLSSGFKNDHDEALALNVVIEVNESGNFACGSSEKVGLQYVEMPVDTSMIAFTTDSSFKRTSVTNLYDTVSYFDAVFCNSWLGINDVQKPSTGLTAFPNPANSSVQLSFSNPDQMGYTLRLFNSLGAEIQRLTGNSNREELSMNTLNSGTYFIEIEFSTGFTQHTKILKY